MKSKIPRRSKDKENCNPKPTAPEKRSPISSGPEKSVPSVKVKVAKDPKRETKTRTKVSFFCAKVTFSKIKFSKITENIS